MNILIWFVVAWFSVAFTVECIDRYIDHLRDRYGVYPTKRQLVLRYRWDAAATFLRGVLGIVTLALMITITWMWSTGA